MNNNTTKTYESLVTRIQEYVENVVQHVHPLGSEDKIPENYDYETASKWIERLNEEETQLEAAYVINYGQFTPVERQELWQLLTIAEKTYGNRVERGWITSTHRRKEHIRKD